MNIGRIKYFSTVNGDGVRTAVFVAGCRLHCEGCFNPELWNFNAGKELDKEMIDRILTSIEPEYIEGLSILGGEPLDVNNQEGVANLIYDFREKFGETKDIWLWTGYEFNSIPKTFFTTYIKDNVNKIVDGPFKLEERDVTLAFRGSKNQNIIDMKER